MYWIDVMSENKGYRVTHYLLSGEKQKKTAFYRKSSVTAAPRINFLKNSTTLTNDVQLDI